MTLLQTERAPRLAVLEQELETGRLVVRAVARRLAGEPAEGFLWRRAASSVAALEPGPGREALWRVVDALSAPVPDAEVLSAALVVYGGYLEGRRRREAAVEVFEAALAVRPEAAELMLHAARSRRKAGNREAALALYRRVRGRGDARLARYSSIGEALLSDAPEAALERVIAEAGAAADAEARAVALEERARLRQRRRAWPDAVADLTRAGLSYDDRRDRLRVAHALADLLLARGDLDGAREALCAAVDLAVPGMADHAVHRLRSIARAQGDQLGLRRWPPEGRSTLVSLMPSRSSRSAGASLAGVVRRWRERLLAAEA